MVSKKYAQIKLMPWILIKYWEKPAAVCWCFRQTWVKAVASCSPSQMTVRSSVPTVQSWFIELFLPILSAWLVSHDRRAVLYVTTDVQQSIHHGNLLLWHLFQLFSLICLLCANPLALISLQWLCVVSWETKMGWSYENIRHDVNPHLDPIVMIIIKRTTWIWSK